ncbi:hypothetical protein LIPSTDRAFT_322040 [Lipomyces starkeyi NRRL Y-11557]|uniref:Uncharacterized protein n=1 Tax=Lipomyces starkeyi NRRL Y-11557 TaxID=675824 RepID=A0A1E3Q5K2_LIPST|nr:hypothetical protein LIPSTDRAFT_322040 [Lipomyces starkeyi NRRL Y-11557]
MLSTNTFAESIVVGRDGCQPRCAKVDNVCMSAYCIHLFCGGILPLYATRPVPVHMRMEY